MIELTTNTKAILVHSSLFEMLDDNQIDDILVHTRSIRVAQNKTIIYPNDLAEGAFWIAYGKVQIFLAPQKGTERTVEILGDGTCFGIAEMLAKQSHVAIVKTVTDCLILHVHRDAILRMAQENLAFSQGLMECVGRQFHGLMRDIERYSQTSRQRLANYLLKQCRNESGEYFFLVTNKALISSLLWLTPETLSRLFHDFSAEGLIKVCGRRIKILDHERMTAIA
jgi:CRP-like cAMP-binding protein